ncbi:M56 family metallopeptidase [Mucilaginibacter flavidus]|uniref:M56 family metallopeptidase n=1 Tax=Mucilaginibacter flavidus TaxID=2949309 RepID=UPI0020927AD4|nr:M56 family metallopeptidase [Mucilaginibacter flavidus]MCO5946945.1 M56 family metallopeptidase [Mucilaginibacter flavidus]
MPALFVFLLKVNVALLLFCAGYYLVIRHLTFYTLNRIYLVAAILFATVYPKINLSDFWQHHQQIAKPVQVVIFNWQAPAKALVSPLPNYWLWAEVTLWAGVIFLAIRLFIQLYSLYRLYRSSTAAKIYNHDVRIIKGSSGPFSFWKSIFINPANHEPADLHSILLHEQVHVSELHTLDVLLAELSTVFYWFNPGVWLMKKAVRENIEFITDRKILNNGADTKQYQYSLVNVSFGAAPQGIVNHFNISTIKKRIIMMNAKRSSKYNLTRYAFLVPAVVALLLIFSISKAAFVKKNNKPIKSFSATEHKLAEKSSRPAAAVAKTNPDFVEVLKSTLAGAKITTKTTDTIRKGGFFLSTNGKSDSLNYVIDGVKSTKADLMKLDEKKIYSVNIMSSESAARVMNNLDNRYGTIFVTTNDSETGKKFKEKIDKADGNGFKLAGTSYTAIGTGKSNLTVVSGSSNSTGISYNSDDTDTLNNVAIVGSGKPTKVQAYALKTRGNKPVTVLASSRNYSTLKSTKAYSGKLYGDSSLKSIITYSLSVDSASSSAYTPVVTRGYGSVGRYTVKPGTNVAWSSNLRSVSSIDHISDKMIIINGKIASQADLKKISAFDIDRMVFKNDEETKDLYGDKAKNGIVFIVTRKSTK